MKAKSMREAPALPPSRSGDNPDYESVSLRDIMARISEETAAEITRVVLEKNKASVLSN